MGFALPIAPGDEVYLQPKTIGCAAACWSQPRVTVVSTAARPILAVRLPDGTEIRTHQDNVRRTQPRPPAERRPRPAPARPVVADCEEVPLW